ncbi:hypothetical protein SH611_04880 [Geminicoccaceae bacterium 1502E]|nr:hypothetical protein [Geminicoccaceae bacterium 1502E]
MERIESLSRWPAPGDGAVLLGRDNKPGEDRAEGEIGSAEPYGALAEAVSSDSGRSHARAAQEKTPLHGAAAFFFARLPASRKKVVGVA